MIFALLWEACRLTLALALLAAALGKARALDRFAESLGALVPVPWPSRRWRRVAALALLAAELAAALAIAAGGAVARSGMTAALALLVAFTGVLIVALVRGQRVSCSCFGAAAHPISAWDVARNLLLMTAAGLPLWAEPPAEEWPASPRLAALAAAALGVWAATNLRRAARRRQGRERAALDEARLGVPVGSALAQAAPGFEGRALASARRVTADELAGQAAVLLFLSAGCPKCHRALPELIALRPGLRATGVPLWILPADPTHELAALLEGSELREHALLVERAVSEQLNPRRVAPAYLFLDHRAVAVASGLIGDDDWRSFTDQLAAASEAASDALDEGAGHGRDDDRAGQKVA